ncbi:hypothetical protein [Kribbella sp. CA-293567]|uniref:hypothetical protein n=1 Tax=Kribbella sp. CA-293567 TaxID=3002436 RepID=UPI0022DD228B|nr:hypothetical protein [Kribbella sp. CA-293567]WBQ02003.1 hypothetical protein OX958_18620 [Kribbella sp. CA-293567]
MSGFRFVRYAAKAAKPVLIINPGHTRGDPYADVRVNLPPGEALTSLTDVLRCSSRKFVHNDRQ